MKDFTQEVNQAMKHETPTERMSIIAHRLIKFITDNRDALSQTQQDELNGIVFQLGWLSAMVHKLERSHDT